MKGCTGKFYFVVLFLSVLTSAEAGIRKFRKNFCQSDGVSSLRG